MGTIAERAAPFLTYLEEWFASLKPFSLEREISDPSTVAVMSVDIINGFCYEGPLASPRVAALVPPIVRLFEHAHRVGIPHYVLIQDTHSPEAVEFGAFARHCVRGSSESATVPELAALPFRDRFTIVEKNSIHPALGTGFDAWLADHPMVTTFIVVGDCTDLCTYQLAMHLRLSANALNIQRRIIVPENAVQTYDLPVPVAKEVGVMPHDGDMLHLIFLYHMALNGIEVVKEII